MALKANTFEGGTAGTSITTANSGGGSGNAFDLVTSGANGTRVYSTAQFMHGSMSALLTASSAGAANNIQFVYQGYTATSIAARAYFRFSTAASVTSRLMGVTPSSGSTVAAIYMKADNTLVVQDATSGDLGVSPALSLDTWYRIELLVLRGTTTTNGTITYAIYAGDSTTALHTYSSAARNTGTSAVTLANVQFGRPATSTATNHVLYLDSVAANDGATAFIGPVPAANVPPTVNAGPDQTNIEPWEPFPVAATATDSDGTVSSIVWSQSPSTPTPVATITPTGFGTADVTIPGTIAGSPITLVATATDDDGATTSDTMTVTVLPVTERAVIGGVEVPGRVRTT